MKIFEGIWSKIMGVVSFMLCPFSSWYSVHMRLVNLYSHHSCKEEKYP
jgi:hypothetical protein